MLVFICLVHICCCFAGATAMACWRWMHVSARATSACVCNLYAAAASPPPASLSLAGYQEGRAYNYASPGFSQATGSFTQLVWASTERVGCALAPSCRVPVFVCNYFPAGNVLSRAWASEVKPPVAAAAPQLGRQPAAVPKPEAASAAKPALLAAPLAVWPHLRDPLSNDGAPVPLAGAPTPYADGLLSAELQSALERHNRYRGLHQAAALTWDTDLAASAQSWAASCPNGHSHQAGVGENMGCE